jgi:CheY-like chemotaxis protein
VMGADSFAREYLCVWQETGSRLIPARQWAACQRLKALPAPGVPPVLGVDVAPDRSATAILACWPDSDDGRPVWEVVDYAPGTDWAADRLRSLRGKHHPPLIVTDNQGPVLTVVDACTKLRVPTRQLTVPEYATACQDALDVIERQAVGHRNQTPLSTAVAGAVKRPIGDGGWGWGRRSATVDVSPFIAASLALWAHEHRPNLVRPMAASG